MKHPPLPPKIGKKNPVSEQHLTIIGSNNPEIIAEIAKLRKEGHIVLSLSKDGFNNAKDFISREMRLHHEQMGLEAFKKKNVDNFNIFLHVQKLRTTMGVKTYFTMKELVDETNMLYATAKDFINLLEVFGYVVVRKGKDNKKEYRLNVTQEEQLAVLNDSIADKAAELDFMEKKRAEMFGVELIKQKDVIPQPSLMVTEEMRDNIASSLAGGDLRDFGLDASFGLNDGETSLCEVPNNHRGNIIYLINRNRKFIGWVTKEEQTHHFHLGSNTNRPIYSMIIPQVHVRHMGRWINSQVNEYYSASSMEHVAGSDIYDVEEIEGHIPVGVAYTQVQLEGFVYAAQRNFKSNIAEDVVKVAKSVGFEVFMQTAQINGNEIIGSIWNKDFVEIVDYCKKDCVCIGLTRNKPEIKEDMADTVENEYEPGFTFFYFWKWDDLAQVWRDFSTKHPKSATTQQIADSMDAFHHIMIVEDMKSHNTQILSESNDLSCGE